MKNLLCCGLLLFWVGCATQPPVLVNEDKDATAALPPKLTESAVTQAANTLAEQAGYRLQEFLAPELDFNPRERFWTVWFSRKTRVAGGYFTIRVQDRTGEAYFIHRE